MRTNKMLAVGGIMSICAYCGEDGKVTREHIIPDFLYKYQKDYGGHVGWNDKAKKIVPSEGKIKDVCATCNNVALGGLDGFAKTMLQESGVLTQNYLQPNLNLKYDYNLLKRWLLKISFNSARAADNNPYAFKRFIQYMLGHEQECKDVIILVGLYKPEILTIEEMAQYHGKLEFGSNGEFNPFHTRISWTPQTDAAFKVRIVVMGALLFHVVIFDKDVKVGHRRAKLRQWLKTNPNMAQVLSDRQLIVVKQLGITFIDTQEFQFARMEALGAFE
ncbi:hypothetical protein R1U54_000069 [Vibrio fluvialis]|nr:hypothetical protein [Vibrio fluvialis]ELP2650016.1 hypothetical protein [Vibrio fluvialis]